MKTTPFNQTTGLAVCGRTTLEPEIFFFFFFFHCVGGQSLLERSEMKFEENVVDLFLSSTARSNNSSLASSCGSFCI